jgi:hypothetical protein
MSSEDKHKQLIEQVKSGRANDAVINALVKNGWKSFPSIERGLHLRIETAGVATFVFQYSSNGKKRRMTLGTYGRRPDGMPLVDARSAIAEARALVKSGKDPLAEKNRAQRSEFIHKKLNP